MRLLHVAPFYEPAWAYGGMARAAAGLCRALAHRGHEVTIATALVDPGHPPEEEREGVRVRRFPSRFLSWLLPWPEGLGPFLSAALARVDAVHVHGHRSGFSVIAARLCRLAGMPYVLTTHGTYPHHGQRVLAKRLFDRLAGDGVVAGARALIAVSRAEAADLPRPARVVPNGVEAGRPATRPATHGGPRLLFVGSDRPQKRGHALPDLLRALPEARLDLVGPFGASFLSRFRSFGARVSVRGVLPPDTLAAAYASAELLVHPAVGEAFGFVPFEAALAGTPAVVAGGHGCGEHFGRAGGCVVPPDDAPTLLAAVRERLGDRARGAAEAAAVAAFARRELTWDRAARDVEAAYAEATSVAGAA